MKKKKLLILFLVLLTSCNQGGNVSNDYQNSLSNDLKELLSSETIKPSENLPFNINASINASTEKKGFYVVSVVLDYKNTIIENIRMISIPSSYSLSSDFSSVANFGYDGKSFSLTEVTDVNKYEFKGFRLSYLTNNENDGNKVLIKGDNVDYKICFDKSEIISL